MFINIYLNFQIWIYTSFDVQKCILQQIAANALRNPPYFRKVISVQRLIDILRQYYWFKPEDDSLAKDPLYHPATEEVVAQRPSQQEIIQLRESLLQIVRVIAPNGLTLAETTNIMNYLLLSPDEEHEGIDIVQMLLSYINLPHRDVNLNVCLHLNNLGGLAPFIHLLKRKSTTFRVWCLKAIGKMLERTELGEKSKQLQTIRLSFIKPYLHPYPLSKHTYFSLMEILLENVDIIKADDPVLNTAQTFKNPSILPVLFELLCMSGNSSLQERVLKNFSDLLVGSPSNRNLFVSQRQWQSWLLGIVSTSKENSSVFLLSIDILTLLHHHCLTRQGGWKVLQQSQTLLYYFGENG